jgi:hypothetical protein
MTWSSFSLKLHASLIECDLAYLLRETSTNNFNRHHSKELMLELFRKLQGSALNMFTSLKAQQFYLEGGHGIEMIKALVNKFHPLDDNAIQNIITSMQALVLLDTEDLSVYRDKLENYNLQLSWVNQDMSPSFLVHLAQTQLGKSRYKNDIEALQMSHTAAGTSFTSLADLCDGLERLDKLKGLPYGGAAPIQKPTSSKTPIPSKKPNTVGFVAAATDTSLPTPDTEFEFHKESWVGTINLLETYVKQLRSMFKCVQCRSNDHTLPSCPLMKNWIIKKKPRPDTNTDKNTKESTVGGANSVLALPTIGDESDNQTPPDPLDTETKRILQRRI